MINLIKQKKVLLLVAGAVLILVAALVTFWILSSKKPPTMQKTPDESSHSAPGAKTPPAANDKQNETTKKDAAAKQPSPAPGQNSAKPKNGGSTGGSSGSSGGSSGGSGGGGGTNPGGCALPVYPDASCTGVPAGTSLTVVTGNMSINTPNTIIEGQDIRGCVEVHAPGVIIRKSKVSCDDSVIISHNDYSGTGLLLEDVELSCNNSLGTAVGDFNVTVRRANVHSCQNGFDVDGSYVIEDSYIHGLIPYNPSTDPHVDGVQITPVGNNITIQHNTIDGNTDGNSAITSPRVSDGIVVNVLIQDNLLFGGGYTLYCQQNGGGSNYRVINNHFSTRYYSTVGAYAPWIGCEDETQVTGNVYHESGLPVPL